MVVGVDPTEAGSGHRGVGLHPPGKAKPDPEVPGRRVRQKAGLNRAILSQLWGKCRRQLDYKCAEEGGVLVIVPAPGTSITCRMCGHGDRANRGAQALFRCVVCGHAEHADVHAARNILARAA